MSFCRWSASGSLNIDGLGMPATFTSEPSHCAGNHEPPDGQSEHHPLERTLIGLFGSVRASRILSVVDAIGVALKPPAWRPLTIWSLAATDSGSSVAYRNLISYPIALACCSSC